MPSAIEITRSLYGTWRLARLDRAGMGWFEVSLQGFWRSFFAFAIVAPGYAVLKLVEHTAVPVPADVSRIVAVDAIAYVLQFVGFPLAMVYLCRVIDRRDRYVGLVVALNWLVVLQMAVIVPTTLLAASQTAPTPIAEILVFVSVVAVLGYQWFIVRTALEVSAWIAVGVVVLDIFIGRVVGQVAFNLLQVSASG